MKMNFLKKIYKRYIMKNRDPIDYMIEMDKMYKNYPPSQITQIQKTRKVESMGMRMKKVFEKNEKN